MASYKRNCILCFIYMLLCSSLLAQSSRPTGSLHGLGTDPSGAIVIGASITLTGADGSVQKVVSEKQGTYYVRSVLA